LATVPAFPLPSATDLCADCLEQSGLCQRHVAHVCPQLAINLGWLRLLGEPHVEQRARQTLPDVATERAIRRNTRRAHRAGLRGLLAHVQTAAA
jgi:hypothetical protein